MKYYVAWMNGLLDLRDVSEPFSSLEKAKVAAANRSLEHGESGFRSKDNSAFEGAWFAVHPSGGMADGPYLSKQNAEFERLKNISDKDSDSFIVDCGGDSGFTAELVAMFGNVGVLRRC